MTALTSKRASRTKSFTTIELAHAAEQVYQGGIACFDTSTGKVTKAKASTTLHPIGLYVEDQLAADGDLVLVRLFEEVHAIWRANDGTDTVVAGDVGGLCYLVDDQTVANADATNTRSVAGRVWAIDSAKGVLVEFRDTGAARAETGLDV